MLIKRISGIKGMINGIQKMIISGIQRNEVFYLFQNYFLHEIIFQRMLIFFLELKGIIWNEMEYSLFFLLQLVNILWNEKELSIQKVSIPKNTLQLHPTLNECEG